MELFSPVAHKHFEDAAVVVVVCVVVCIYFWRFCTFSGVLLYRSLPPFELLAGSPLLVQFSSERINKRVWGKKRVLLFVCTFHAHLVEMSNLLSF